MSARPCAAGSSVLRDFGIALSLANLCQLRVWTSIHSPPSSMRADHAAAIANTVVLSLLLWGAARLVRRSGSGRVLAAVRVLVVVALLACIPSIVRAISPALEVTSWFPVARASFFALTLAGALHLAVRGTIARISAAACALLLVSLPALTVTAGRSAWQILALTRRSAPAQAQASARSEARPQAAASGTRARAVVLLLDEFDYALAFSESAPRLPALERLRGESVWASHAYPPDMSTIQSVPCYLIGKRVPHARLTPDGGLQIGFSTPPKWVSASDEPTLFRQLREMGMRSVAVGNALPYTRLFHRDALCVDPRGGGAMQARVTNKMVSHVTTMLSDAPIPLTRPTARIRGYVLKRSAIWAHRDSLAAMERIAADPGIDFAFLHANVPHPPFIYDRAAGAFSTSPGTTYLDNLVLADQTVAQVRSAMEKSGLWDRSTVIVTSDHWLRWDRPESLPEDHRIPLFLKLPGRQPGLHYRSEFNTVLLHDLLLAILRRELETPGDAAHWLDQHRTFGESPGTIGVGRSSREDPDALIDSAP